MSLSLLDKQTLPFVWDTLPTTVTLIGNNALRATGLRHLLSNTHYLIRERSLDECLRLRALSDGRPSLFVLDAHLYEDGTAAAVQQLKAAHPDTRVVVLADRVALLSSIIARRAGADGYCLTTQGPEVLLKSLELALLGQIVLPSVLVVSWLDGLSDPQGHERPEAPEVTRGTDPRVHKLSPREREILRLLMEGAQNKVIARKLDVAEATVKVHVKAILRKIGAGNRTQAALWATQHLSNRGTAST